MRKIKIYLLLFTILVILTACGQEEDAPSLIIPESSPVSDTTAPPSPSVSEPIPSEIITKDDSRPPREGMVRSFLTNEWVDADVA